MRFTQHYLDCLSQASYLVGDETTGRAAVVDPRRDVDEYLAEAADAGLTITHVIETHVHADFLSGHLELAAATGAEIVYGEAADVEFPVHHAADGERISLGEVTLEVRTTPGHTPESISIVVWEHPDDEVPYGVLTGDTLFIGDVGRPDLLSSVGVSADELAGRLHDSLHEKLLTLPDATRVFPAHGAGSACGEDLSTETSSTIGDQRRSNYALAPMSRERFVEVVTEGQPPAPAYFAYDAGANRRDHDLLPPGAPPALDVDGVRAAQGAGAVVVDVRPAADFAAGHLAGSVNLGLDGRYAEMAGTTLAPDDDIVLVTGPGQATEARVRLGRIGFDRVLGALEGPEAALAAHPELSRRASRLTADALDARRAEDPSIQVVDVRGPGERLAGTIPGALSIPMAELRARRAELDPSRPVVVHCAGGYRSSLAASWLRSQGLDDVSDLVGGYAAWADRHAAA
ncbi:rhodanese-like domain-containing protein [Iamia majanohamensis]|uniref:Rhodanese-like domain-containing protein n=1 Tax=Iamia majanohamensis TaxID=467976 RepID=A0AAE9YCN9_9ACTN|nr:rhodanese-like domain-containing protein [Iamia majanohamensis]WCO68778.1 rhodanese-like domain-containing protein [Iamia majanohamensis]